MGEEQAESIARMAYLTLGINATAQPVGTALHNKRYLRKHGKDAYYGQSANKDRDQKQNQES